MSLPLYFKQNQNESNKIEITEYSNSQEVRTLLQLPDQIHIHDWNDIQIPLCLSDFIFNNCNGGSGNIDLAFDTEQQKIDLDNIFNIPNFRSINTINNPVNSNFNFVSSHENYISIIPDQLTNTIEIDTTEFNNFIINLYDNTNSLLDLFSNKTDFPITDIGRGYNTHPFFIHTPDISFSSPETDFIITAIPPNEIHFDLSGYQNKYNNAESDYNNLNINNINTNQTPKIKAIFPTSAQSVSTGNYTPYSGSSSFLNFNAVGHRAAYGPFLIDTDIITDSIITIKYIATVNGTNTQPIRFQIESNISKLLAGSTLSSLVTSPSDTFTPTGTPQSYHRTFVLNSYTFDPGYIYSVFFLLRRITNGGTNNTSPIYITSVNLFHGINKIY